MNFACAITSHYATLHIRPVMWSSTLWVQVQRIAEALDEGHSAATSLAVRGRNASPAADRSEDGAHKDLQYIPDKG